MSILFYDSIPGEAVPFDPFILIPGGGVRSGVSAIAKPITGVFDDIAKGLSRIFVRPAASPITFGGQAAARGTRTVPVALPTVSTGTKIVTGAGIVSVPVTTGILSLSEGGQNLVTTTGQAAAGVSSFTASTAQFFKENPIVLFALIGLGAIMVLKK